MTEVASERGRQTVTVIPIGTEVYVWRGAELKIDGNGKLVRIPGVNIHMHPVKAVIVVPSYALMTHRPGGRYREPIPVRQFWHQGYRIQVDESALRIVDQPDPERKRCRECRLPFTEEFSRKNDGEWRVGYCGC